jgi:hypothetical protein
MLAVERAGKAATTAADSVDAANRRRVIALLLGILILISRSENRRIL